MSGKGAAIVGALAVGVFLAVLFPVVLVHMQVQTLTDEYAACGQQSGAEPGVVPALETDGGELSEEQLRNAAAVVAEGRRRGVPERGIVIALAVAHQESRFLNYANDGHGADLDDSQRGIERSLSLPHDAVGSDHGSLGVFQQQWPWWGQMSDLMDPMVSAGKFYAALSDVSAWEILPVTAAAQLVQRSAYPNAYADDELVAQRLLGEPAIGDEAGELSSADSRCATTLGECPSTGTVAEIGLTPDALRVLRCVRQTFGPQSVLGVGDRPDNAGSDHPSGRAVDIMISGWQTSSGRSHGDQIAAWAQDNAEALGVRYVIWRGRIWSTDRADEGARPYGHPSGASNATAQHMDHVHVSVYGNAGTGFGGGGAVVFPLPRDSGYQDQQNWGHESAYWGRGHTGTDLSVACGTPVLAATAGTVAVRTDQAWSGRWLVQVGTGDGQLTTWYAHMQGLDVADGQMVGAGTRIGSVGSEGNSTGCHLHFEVHPTGGSIYEDNVDPTPWLGEHVGQGAPGGAVAVPISDRVDSGSLDFVLGTFNVLGNSHTEASGNRSSMASGLVRIRWAIRLLDRHRVDVVGLQELQQAQWRDFLRVAGDRYEVFPGPRSRLRDTENAIVWRKSQWEFDGAETVAIPYFNGRIRQMPVVLLRDRATGDRAFFANFHNPASVKRFASQQRWRDMATRREMDLVRRLTETYRLPVFVTGDMNDRDRFFCRFTAGGGMVAANGGSNNGVCDPPDQARIDWIFGTPGVEFSDYTVDQDNLVRRTSDHPMVVARVRSGS